MSLLFYREPGRAPLTSSMVLLLRQEADQHAMGDSLLMVLQTLYMNHLAGRPSSPSCYCKYLYESSRHRRPIFKGAGLGTSMEVERLPSLKLYRLLTRIRL